METVLQRAINWETLSHITTEERAMHVTLEASDAHIFNEPVVEHLAFYCERLQCDGALLSDAYQQVSATFAANEQHLHILDSSSNAWPLGGVESPYVPKFLYARGNLSLLKSPKVALLGTRTPSKEGKELAIATAQTLGKAGVCVVGGLSAGVEALGHRSALTASRPTIGVAATELGSSYPASHKQLQEDIGKWGLLITRFAPGSEMEKVHLLLRNRLMALLTDVLVLVEDRDGGTAVSQGADALSRGQPVIIYQKSWENQGLLWPRRLAASPLVRVIEHPKQVVRALEQILGTKKQSTGDEAAELQLDLFG